MCDSPQYLAGTRLDAVDIILADDSADAFRALGECVVKVDVYCSARIVSGEQTLPDDKAPVLVAVDLNNESFGTVCDLLSGGWAGTVRATGIYNGKRLPSAVAQVRSGDIPALHAKLLDRLPGFGCFAVMVTA